MWRWPVRAFESIKEFINFLGFLATLGLAAPFSLSEGVSFVLQYQSYILSAKFGSLVCSVFFLYFFLVEYRHRDIPITILRTEIDVQFVTQDGSVVRVVKAQDLRANHGNVTAYYSHLVPDPPGKIAGENHCNPEYRPCWKIDYRDGTQVSTTTNSDPAEYVGDETAGFKIVHRFPRPLPKKWYALNTSTVKRTSVYYWIDSFKEKSNFYAVRSEIYPHKEVVLRIHFLPGQKLEKYSAEIRSTHGIETSPLTWLPGGPNRGDILEYKARGIRNVLYRINWTLK